MAEIVEARHAGEFLLGEANHNRSREVATIVSGVEVLAGQVLSKHATNEGVVTAGVPAFTGTGDGTMTMADPATDETTQEGTYIVRLIEGAANAGNFQVIRPDGSIDGLAVVGVAYTGDIKFTIADGATDFSNAAQFTVAVTIAEIATAGLYDLYDPEGTDGDQNAVAIAMYPLAAAATNRKITIIAREATVNGKCLEWDDADAGEILVGIASLATQQIIVR